MRSKNLIGAGLCEWFEARFGISPNFRVDFNESAGHGQIPPPILRLGNGLPG